MTSITLVASSTVRHIGPTTSFLKKSGTIPLLLIKPSVVLNPTREQCDEGPLIELPVSVPSQTAPKLDAMDAAVPPLDPAGTYSRL